MWPETTSTRAWRHEDGASTRRPGEPERMRRIPEIPMQLVPAVISAEMSAVDRAMVEDYGIDLIQMMENAGRALAALARDRFLDGDPPGKTVVVLAGPRGNGSGALVAGRRLHGSGATIRTVLAHEPDRFAPVPAKQLAIHGVIGYSLRGAPHGGAEALIRWSGSAGAPILALDVPSGMDATSGDVHEATVRATATLTLALP